MINIHKLLEHMEQEGTNPHNEKHMRDFIDNKEAFTFYQILNDTKTDGGYLLLDRDIAIHGLTYSQSIDFFIFSDEISNFMNNTDTVTSIEFGVEMQHCLQNLGKYIQGINSNLPKFEYEAKIKKAILYLSNANDMIAKHKSETVHD